MQVINQLFEEITKEYSLQILKWAYKKCGDGYRAEKLAQEVLTQVFSAIQKSKEAGKTIEQMEHFIWRIAHYVWCHSLRGKTLLCSGLYPQGNGTGGYRNHPFGYGTGMRQYGADGGGSVHIADGTSGSTSCR